MDIWVWLLLAALTALGVALYRRSRREADAEVGVPDRGEELERERQRARAIEAAVRSAPDGENPYV
jgi:hypothetical protein